MAVKIYAITLGHIMPTTLDIEGILKLLPHRAPFLLIDKVTDVVANEYAEVVKSISYNEPWAVGHFPNMPVFPGVLAIESMAQACGILGAYSLGIDFNSGSSQLLFTGLDGVKFRKKIVPGDQLHIKVKLLKKRLHFYSFDCEAFVDEQLAVKAKITCAFIDGK